MDEMSRPHAIVAIKKGHMDAYEYYTIYYKKETYLATYESTFNSVGNPDEWEILKEMKKMEVETPIEKRTAGDKKKVDFCHVVNSGSTI